MYIWVSEGIEKQNWETCKGNTASYDKNLEWIYHLLINYFG